MTMTGAVGENSQNDVSMDEIVNHASSICRWSWKKTLSSFVNDLEPPN